MADKPPKKPKRVSMRGMGADAFFNPPSEEKEEPVSQDESKPASPLTDSPESQQNSVPVNQQTSMPTSQDTILPVTQGISTPAKRQDDLPVSQEAITTVSSSYEAQIEQHTDIPVSHIANMPAKQLTGKPVKDLIKATYYIYPDQDMKLERIRLARRVRGERVDKSELIREAIDKLVE